MLGVRSLLSISLGVLACLPLPFQDPKPAAEEEAAQAQHELSLARRWGKQLDGRSFEVLERGLVVARVQYSTQELSRGDRKFLELKEARYEPADRAHPVETVTWLDLGAQFASTEIWLFEASPEKRQLARIRLEGTRLKGTVRGKEIVRNVPPPVVSEPALLLQAHLLARSEYKEKLVNRVHFDRRGLAVELGERLTLAPSDEPIPGVSQVILHKTGRGKTLATWFLDPEGLPLRATWKAKPQRTWRRIEPEED